MLFCLFPKADAKTGKRTIKRQKSTGSEPTAQGKGQSAGAEPKKQEKAEAPAQKKKKLANTAAKAFGAAVKTKAAQAEALTAGSSLLKMIDNRAEWSWALGLKQPLKDAIEALEGGLDEFGVAFTTLTPDSVKKDYADTWEASCQSFSLQTEPLILRVQTETATLRRVHDARFPQETPQKQKTTPKTTVPKRKGTTEEW